MGRRDSCHALREYNLRMRQCALLILAALLMRAEALRIVNAADGAEGGVAPGEIVTIYIPGFGPSVMAGQQVTADGRVATEIAGTRVLFDGVPAPLASAVRG